MLCVDVLSSNTARLLCINARTRPTKCVDTLLAAEHFYLSAEVADTAATHLGQAQAAYHWGGGRTHLRYQVSALSTHPLLLKPI